MDASISTCGAGGRIERLLQRLTERLRERPWFLSRPILLAESLRKTEGLPVHRRRAEAYAHLLRRAPVEVAREEMIVGTHPGDRPEGIEQGALSSAREYMASQSAPWQFQRTRLADMERQAVEEGLIHHVAWRDSHIIVDYPKVLRLGFAGLEEEVRAARPKADEAGKGFLDSVLVTLHAAREFIRRYAALAAAEGMADAAGRCEWVSTHPPRTFAEALQLYWLTHLLVAFEEGGWGFSFGRFDQYLFPFYERDLAEGGLSEQSALEMIQCFWIKLNEYQVTGDSQTLNSQNLTLGGVDEAGHDASNGLTDLALEATRALRLRLPNVSVRVHAGTADRLWGRIAGLMQEGIGQPQVYNDEIMAPSLSRHIPMPIEEARSYAIQGCIETHIPGRCAPWMDCAINLPGCLLLALNGGRGWRSGGRLGAETPALERLRTFGDLLAAYESQVAHVVGVLSDLRRRFDTFQPTCEAVPFQSALIADCIGRGRDAYDGGACRKWGGVYCVGSATAADSLLALKRVLDGCAPQGIALPAFLSALRSEGDPSLRAWARGLPKYGNDEDEADSMAGRVCGFVCDAVLSRGRCDDGRLLPMLSSHTLNVRFGQLTPATPDGRPAGEPLSNGISPSFGRDRRGPTAVIRSVARMDFTRSTGGSLLNLKFVPATFRGQEGAMKLASLLKTYFALGGHQVQVNFVDQETLLDAQVHPYRHEGLVVRVSGFCSKFICLSKELQDEIIRRTPQQA